MDLLKRWKQNVAAGNSRLMEQYFHEIEKQYAGRERHYHNLDHIRQLFVLSDKYKTVLNSQTVVDLSIFFHDVVYDAGRSDNELQSAGLAKKMLAGLDIPPEIISKVNEYIIATKDHFKVDTEDSDLKYFLDFDLSILSADPQHYKQYASQIRQEYASIPDVFYNAGRITFLEKSLHLKHLFFTEQFRCLESKARENIEWEIQLLRQG